MKPEIKAKWVEALRSGGYQQAKGRLRRDDTFCCLGVLCDLYNKEHDRNWQPAGLPDGGFWCDGYSGRLSPNVSKWAGLHFSNPLLPLETGYLSLAGANDGGCTFTEIANLIEKHL